MDMIAKKVSEYTNAIAEVERFFQNPTIKEKTVTNRLKKLGYEISPLVMGDWWRIEKNDCGRYFFGFDAVVDELIELESIPLKVKCVNCHFSKPSFMDDEYRLACDNDPFSFRLPDDEIVCPLFLEDDLPF